MATKSFRLLRALRASARESSFGSLHWARRLRKPVDDARDAVLHALQTKVQNQPKLQLRQHQMRAQLFRVDGMVFLHGFDLHNDRLLHQ